MYIEGVNGHVKKPAVVVGVTLPVPVTSAAPPVGVNVASAAQRSQKNTQLPPPPVRAANDTFTNVKPYVGFGATTAAAHAVADSENCVVAPTEAAPSWPPGAVVVSTSTTVEFSTCGNGVAESDRVLDTVCEGVKVLVGVWLVVAPVLGV